MRLTNFNKMIETFETIYDKTLDSEVLKIYFGICEEIPSDEAEAVTERCLQKYKIFPKLAEIFEAFEFIHTGDSYLDKELREERRKEREE